MRRLRHGLVTFIRDQPLLWRAWRTPQFQRAVPARIRPAVLNRLMYGSGEPQWIRDVMIPDLRREVSALDPPELDVLEISGDFWQAEPWKSYTALDFPEFDLCRPSDALPGPFDLVICEQVLEHVVDPITAVDTLRRLCKPDGTVLVSTPFMIRIHDFPGDYWRFTPAGMGVLLRSRGLEPLWIRSWGNRDVINATLDHWVPRFPRQSLRNEAHLPVVVWAFARPASTTE